MKAFRLPKYALCLALTIVFLSNINFASSQRDNLSTFEDRLLGIRFEYPSTWKEESADASLMLDSQNSKPTLKLVLNHCREGVIGCYQLPQINIKIFEIKSSDKFMALDDYAKEQIRNIQKQLSGSDSLSNGEDYNLVALNSSSIAGKRAIVHIFSYTSKLLNYFDQPDKNKILQMNVYMVNNESMNNQKLYHIEYLATQGDEYAKFLPSTKQILSSFELIPLVG